MLAFLAMLAFAAPPTGDDVLSRALYFVRRDVCLILEPDAPQVPSWDLDKTGKLAPMKSSAPHCDSSTPAIKLLVALEQGVALVDKSVDAKDGDFEASFAKLFAAPLVSSRASTPKNGDLRAFDPKALHAAFDKLYAPPTATKLGVVLQKLYDATVKDSVARFVIDLADLTASKSKVAREADKLKKRLMTSTEQLGPDDFRGATNALVSDPDAAARVDPLTTAFVLRRQLDGTLPVVVESVRTVTCAYDPPSCNRLR
jgi:hypothetical protein